MFYSQKDIPANLLRYKDLFVYEQQSKKEEVLDEEFDEKILKMIGEPAPVKAKTISMTQRLMPLFKAAAVVAIILTLNNALQVAFNHDNGFDDATINIAEFQKPSEGPSVAMSDSLKIDTLKKADIPASTIR